MAHKTRQLQMISWCEEKWQQEEDRYMFFYCFDDQQHGGEEAMHL